MSDWRDFLERLIYQGLGNRRFTQDSPVLPDVWIHYGLQPNEPVDLLLTPTFDAKAPENHAANLRVAHGIVLYFGKSDAGWWRRGLNEIATVNCPKAIYVAAVNAGQRIRTREADIFREQGPVGLDELQPFLDRLKHWT